MIDELVTSIRKNACHFDACGMCPKRDATCLDRLALQAADAVAEMRELLDEAKHNYDLAVEETERLTQMVEKNAKKPRWIPVTERLPEEMDRSCGGWSAEIRPSDDVLVWLSSENRQNVAWYSHTYNEWTTVDENNVYCFEEISHWMPQPEPPKEE